uniref:COP1-interacting protein 7-like n=1 Tax=Erigeron canadensis TaxID=72917 RepID=UPI001CB9B3AC|nr:COP1-interacting protein 7-like [Erigeron canadensis]
MDTRSRLDYALFQLTPTRTRCDLVICAGDCKEKIASGLLEPFNAHCKFVKDQVSKGGYSVTLSSTSSWFTKSTLERFVRFVSTPDVLERCITIEREIENIDCSIITSVPSDSQTVYGLDEHSTKSAAFAYRPEENTSDAIHEEDPKVHLQRVLETRKATLQREQAMVYARAIIAGFETDTLQDLICFADAFGSPRLREACSSFMELCNIKSNDIAWMDQVAAMQAYSCSPYSYMENDLGQELRINVQNDHFATKKQDGYVDGTETDLGLSHGNHVPQYMHTFPGGPMFQPPYQGHPFPGMILPPYYQGNLPFPPNMEDSRSRGKRIHKKRSENDNFDSSDSSSGRDSDSYEMGSSRKVLIRNINYITSARNEAENESYAIQDPDRTVDKHEEQKETQQWNIFQNLLLKDADDTDHIGNLRSGEELSPVIKKRPMFEKEFGSHKSTTAGKHKEEWFLRSLPDKVIQEKSKDIFEDHINSVETRKVGLVNDPFAVQARSANDLSDSQLRTRDILMVSESNATRKKVEANCVSEPNDLYMVLERDTTRQQAVPAWTPEMESGNSNDKVIKLNSAEEIKSTVHAKEIKSRTKTPVGKSLERKVSTIEAKSKVLTGSKSMKPTATKATMLKAKSNKEEEKRKKMEELLVQRQKRIAERSASASKTAKIDKPKAVVSKDMNKPKKQVISSSTINRLSTARVVNPKVLPTESKPGNKPMKVAAKRNNEPKPVNKPTKVTAKNSGVSHTVFSQNTTDSEKKRGKLQNVKPLGKNNSSKNINGPKNKIADLHNSKQLPKASTTKKTGNEVARIVVSTPTESDNMKGANKTLQEPSLVHETDIPVSDSIARSANKATNSVTFRNIDKHLGAKENTVVKVNDQIRMRDISTPSPSKSSVERNSSKKKWGNFETTSKALSGFKKLLFFGKRS